MRKPWAVRVMTMGSSSIRSSGLKVSSNSVMRVRRASPYFSLTRRRSALTSARRRASSSRIAFRRAISSMSPRYSSKSFSRSKATRRWRRMSRMAWAWASERPKRSMRAMRALGRPRSRGSGR